VWRAHADAEDVWLTAWPVQGPAGATEVQVPEEVGAFEARYVISLPEGGYKVVGSVAFEVQPVTASVTAPAEAVGGSDVSVEWRGPGNRGHFPPSLPAGAAQAPVGARAPTAAG